MKILFCSSEVVPFAKTGGLADVAGALPKALAKKGADVKITMPLYKNIKPKSNTPLAHTPVAKNVDCLFIENDSFFNRDGLYGTSLGDHPDNLERFAFYCMKTLALMKDIDFQPDIIHCNDWQSALIPVYLKSIFRDDSFFKKAKTVFTIHNLAYQGVFAENEFNKIGIDRSLFGIQGLEFYGKVNLLKGALIFSDHLTTVSPTYAREIQTKEFGCGLEGVLYERRNNLSGILNGLDYDIWNPQVDSLIFEKFSSDDLSGKAKNKQLLQKQSGLAVDKSIPLFGMISRLAEQKGLDLLAKTIEQLMKLNIQVIILGTGEKYYHDLLGAMAKKYPRKLSLNLKFDDKLAHSIYAASDIFLMPSRYEPCGLGQLISLKYGTIPLVFKTGGLADTIEDFDEKRGCGNGFVFDEYDPEVFFETIKRSIDTYRIKELWKELVLAAFACDFSWENSAKHYLDLYKRIMTNA
jgi:starch synthase